MTNKTHIEQLLEEKEFKRRGGSWLGEARKWMQWNCLNGSDVRWGSDEALRTTHGPLTVKDVEELAADIAWKAVQEDRKRRTNPIEVVLSND